MRGKRDAVCFEQPSVGSQEDSALRISSHGTIQAKLAFALLFLTAAGAGAQSAPSTQDGPMSVTPPQEVAPPAPQPSVDGSYALGPGIDAPKILQATPAVYPAETPPETPKNNSVIALVIQADGAPAHAHVVRSAGNSFDSAAMEAVQASKFAPGTLNGQPVPVRIRVGVHFSADRRPAIPLILVPPHRSPGEASSVDSEPVPIHRAELEYSDEARRMKITGNVLVSMLVTVEGLPTEIRVERSLGHGLDEKALEAASQYRFRPAMKDGKPVARRVNIEMNFQLY